MSWMHFFRQQSLLALLVPPSREALALDCPPALAAADALRRSWRRHLVIVLGFLALGLALLPFDVVFSRWFFYVSPREPKILETVLVNTVGFGHGVGVAVIAWAVFALDVRQRKVGLSVLTTCLAAGSAANIVKLLVGRTRPRHYDFLSDRTADTFVGWLPLLSHGTGQQSLPSAHTATATALAIILTAAYPRGRWVFGTLAAFVALHRLHGGAHYLSDVCAGAAVGWAVGQCCRWAALRYGYVRPLPPAEAMRG
jgi:membrane-associated phospholipid phosphatase